VSDVHAASPPTATTRATSAGASQASATSDGPCLLPDPEAGALAGGDPLSMLYVCESQDRQLGLDEATKRMDALQTERQEALGQEQQAIREADNAAKNHSFWSDLGNVCGEVAKVAAVVASVAAAVATAGAASGLTVATVLAVAGAGLSCASFADGELHVLRGLGVDATTAGWVDLGISVGGAVMSAGTSMVSGTTTLSGTLSNVDRAAVVASGAASAGSAAAGIEASEAQAQTDSAAADEVAAQARSHRALRLVQAVVDDTQSSEEQSEQILATIASTEATREQTDENAASAVRG